MKISIPLLLLIVGSLSLKVYGQSDVEIQKAADDKSYKATTESYCPKYPYQCIIPKPVHDTLTDRFEKKKGTYLVPADHYLETQTVESRLKVTCPEKANAIAMEGGTVVTVMYNPGFQWAVMLRHGSYFTVYAQLDTVLVTRGQEVQQNEKLGTIQTVNGTTMLHFEFWKGNQIVNPEGWFVRRVKASQE